MKIPHMTLHLTRKHTNLTLQERHEYREIMLRETPVLRSKGSKRRRKLLKCPLCPSNVQRLDNHIMNIHGKKRGSKIMKALIAKARELEAQRAATIEQDKTIDESEEDKTLDETEEDKTLDETDTDRTIDETEERRTQADMTKQYSTRSDGLEESEEDWMEEEKGISNKSYGEELVRAFVKHLRMIRKRAGCSEEKADSAPRENGKKVKRMLKWAGGLDLVTKKEVLHQIVSKLWNMAPETGFRYLASLKRFIRFLITEEEASEVLTFEKITRCLYRCEDFMESLSERIMNSSSAATSKPTSE
ncbi:uncharacterized protein LOC121419878 [Lytechinus variegatus]|uniref:uncharacterized protein LOC121419878 n=1 Tax=Lytechinus variegatus TaxID=7654 RepID=UPI001BB22CA7|nr:uncharacterized protein LOC121419878 [Lytechinus variegatus]